MGDERIKASKDSDVLKNAVREATDGRLDLPRPGEVDELAEQVATPGGIRTNEGEEGGPPHGDGGGGGGGGGGGDGGGGGGGGDGGDGGGDGGGGGGGGGAGDDGGGGAEGGTPGGPKDPDEDRFSAVSRGDVEVGRAVAEGRIRTRIDREPGAEEIGGQQQR